MINKKVFLESVECPVFSWYNLNEPTVNETDEAINYGRDFRIYEGTTIGEIARKQFPTGVLVDEGGVRTGASRTKELIKNEEIIFEAVFINNELITRPDILIKEADDSFSFIEVKSGVNAKIKYFQDMAYTAMVLNKCGIDIKKAYLMLISKDYRLGQDEKYLFKRIDKTEEVKIIRDEYLCIEDDIYRLISSKDRPEIKKRFSCKGCKKYSECFSELDKDHIFFLPRISEKKYNELTDMGIEKISDIPQTYKLTATQIPVRNAIINNETIINPGLGNKLDEIKWPAYYLDFETMMTALPLYEEVAPYTQVPTQFSIHVCDQIGQIREHYDYLASIDHDCRRNLACELINKLGTEGSVLVYTSFENRIINGLINDFPELNEKLENILLRIIDLEKIVKEIYHPNFWGSYSIKKVLPALVPEMTYSNLEIGDGSTAMAAFALMVLGEIEICQHENIKKNLLTYCEQDTMAMVKLHEALYGFI